MSHLDGPTLPTRLVEELVEKIRATTGVLLEPCYNVDPAILSRSRSLHCQGVWVTCKGAYPTSANHHHNHHQQREDRQPQQQQQQHQDESLTCHSACPFLIRIYIRPSVETCSSNAETPTASACATMPYRYIWHAEKLVALHNHPVTIPRDLQRVSSPVAPAVLPSSSSVPSPPPPARPTNPCSAVANPRQDAAAAATQADPRSVLSAQCTLDAMVQAQQSAHSTRSRIQNHLTLTSPRASHAARVPNRAMPTNSTRTTVASGLTLGSMRQTMRQLPRPSTPSPFLFSVESGTPCMPNSLTPASVAAPCNPSSSSSAAQAPGFRQGFDCDWDDWTSRMSWMDRDSAKEHVVQTARSQGFQVVTRSSNKFATYMRCAGAATLNNDSATLAADSRLGSCPFQVKLVPDRTAVAGTLTVWRCNILVSRHNHAPASALQLEPTRSSRGGERKRRLLERDHDCIVELHKTAHLDCGASDSLRSTLAELPPESSGATHQEQADPDAKSWKGWAEESKFSVTSSQASKVSAVVALLNMRNAAAHKVAPRASAHRSTPAVEPGCPLPHSTHHIVHTGPPKPRRLRRSWW